MTQPVPYSVPAPVVRPPLTAPMRRAARIAGGVGFTLMTVGWTLFATAGAAGLLWLALSAILRGVAQNDARFAAQLATVERYLATLPLALIAAALVVVVLLGAALWVTGLLVSSAILRRSGHPHPWGVTWAGLGLGIVASGIASGVVQLLSQVSGTVLNQLPTGDGSSDPAAAVGAALAVSAVWLVILLAVHVVAGVLLWWWMAWAMRPTVAGRSGDLAIP